jgi:hypothetical protein
LLGTFWILKWRGDYVLYLCGTNLIYPILNYENGLITARNNQNWQYSHSLCWRHDRRNVNKTHLLSPGLWLMSSLTTLLYGDYHYTRYTTINPRPRNNRGAAGYLILIWNFNTCLWITIFIKRNNIITIIAHSGNGFFATSGAHLLLLGLKYSRRFRGGEHANRIISNRQTAGIPRF